MYFTRSFNIIPFRDTGDPEKPHAIQFSAAWNQYSDSVRTGTLSGQTMIPGEIPIIAKVSWIYVLK
jgi:hypothetical protein